MLSTLCALECRRVVSQTSNIGQSVAFITGPWGTDSQSRIKPHTCPSHAPARTPSLTRARQTFSPHLTPVGAAPSNPPLPAREVVVRILPQSFFWAGIVLLFAPLHRLSLLYHSQHSHPPPYSNRTHSLFALTKHNDLTLLISKSPISSLYHHQRRSRPSYRSPLGCISNTLPAISACERMRNRF